MQGALRLSASLSYPWRQSEPIEILADGDQFFPALLNAISTAQYTVHIELYWFESGAIANQFISVLEQVVQAGVKVSLLLDEFGSKDLNNADQQRLVEANVLLGWYNPIAFNRLHLVLQRDHTKLFIIDGWHVFVGGTGIADNFLLTSNPIAPRSKPGQPRRSQQTTSQQWRENMFRIQGPVAQDCLQSIITKWEKSETEQVNTPPWLQTSIAQLLNSSYRAKQAMSEQTIKVRWLVVAGPQQRQILKAVIEQIHQAQQSIIIATAYFAPPPRLRSALKKAMRRGVKVQIIVPGEQSDHPILQLAGRYYYHSLLKHGVEIFEYQHRFTHMKVVVSDDTLCVGSTNLDLYTQRWSLEANMMIKSAQCAERMREILQQDLSKSKRIDKVKWAKRAYVTRGMIYLAYKIAVFADGLSRQLRLLRQQTKVERRRKQRTDL